MTMREPEDRSFAMEEAERASHDLPDQIARVRAEIAAARAKLAKSAREIAREQDQDGGAEA